MRKFNLRSFFHFLSRNKLYTFINIFGLSLSLMFVILIADYTRRQLTTDARQQKADRIYLLGNERFTGSAYRVADRLLQRYPEIEKVSAATPYGPAPVRAGEGKMNAYLFFADTTFFDLFSFRLKEGDERHALTSPDNAVITERFARKAFGNESPLGKTIRFQLGEEQKERVVSGVIEDFENSVFPDQTDIILRMEEMGDYNPSIIAPGMNNAGGALLFLLEKQGADLPAKTEDMAAYFKEFFWIYERGVCERVELLPLRDVYFHAKDAPGLRAGNWSFVMILLSVGVLILLFAVINYVNLTMAQTGFRAREMATRRLLGSSRGEIMLKMIVESTIMCAAAFVAGLLLAIAAEPVASRLLDGAVNIRQSLTPATAAVYAGAVLLLGVLSGIIPALAISGYKPIEVVRGTLRRRTKMVYSKFFITFQNVIAVTLVGCSIALVLQIRHMLRAPMGYDTENIIDIPTDNFTSYDRVRAFRSELLSLACVEEVAFSEGTPLDRGNNNTIRYGEGMVSFQVFYGDSAFFSMMGFAPLRDNRLSTAEFWFNEEALAELELPHDAPSVPFNRGDERWECKIGGIYRNFRIGDAISPKTSAMLFNRGNYDRYNTDTEHRMPWNVLVKTKGDPQRAYADVSAVYRRITEDAEFRGKYIEQKLWEAYAQPRRLTHIVMLFTLIALVISTLGLLAMSTYFIQQRRTEVAVRKVFGSTRSQALQRLVMSFMQLVGVAILLAVPLIWVAMERWLRDYPERIRLTPDIFVVAGAFVALVALLTVLWQSRRAANANPIDSLRS